LSKRKGKTIKKKLFMASKNMSPFDQEGWEGGYWVLLLGSLLALNPLLNIKQYLRVDRPLFFLGNTDNLFMDFLGQPEVKSYRFFHSSILAVIFPLPITA